MLLDPAHLIESFGAWAIAGVATILFLETATILLSFLPGDSLIFVLGMTLSLSNNPWLIVVASPVLVLAAVSGSQFGFWTGQRVGPALFSRRKQGWLINQGTFDQAQAILDKYGTRAIIIARFIPILRAIVPMLVGILKMNSRAYFRANLIGGILWAGGLSLLGWSLGKVEYVRENFDAWLLGFVIVSSLPFPVELFRAWRKNKKN